METLKIQFIQSEVHWIKKRPVFINETTHPELKGMTLSEMEEYVRQNIENMKPLDEEYFSSLEEEVMLGGEESDGYHSEEEELVIKVKTDEDEYEYEDDND